MTPRSPIDDGASKPPLGLRDQILSSARTFLAYFQARALLLAIEAREAYDQTGRRLAFTAAGGAILFLGYVLLLTALIPLIAEWWGVAWGVVCFIAAAIHIIGGGVLLLLARLLFSNPMFEETQNEIEKDREWLSRNIPTSNAKKRR